MKRIVSALFALVSVTSAWGAAFQNGGFESGFPTADPCNTPLLHGDNTSIPGWTVMSFSAGGGPAFGSIDYVTPSCWTPSEGSRSLDLIGFGDTVGGIEQTFDTTVGQGYQVIFDLAGNPGAGFPTMKDITVGIDNATIGWSFYTGNELAPPLHTSASMGWTPHAFTFAATGTTTRLSFVSSAAVGYAGAALDNVRVVPIPANGWQPAGGNVFSGTYAGSPFPRAGAMICSGAGSMWNQTGSPLVYPPFVTNFGLQGTVVASYAVPIRNISEGFCGTDWEVFNRAAAPGNITVSYTYAGNHGPNPVGSPGTELEFAL